MKNQVILLAFILASCSKSLNKPGNPEINSQTTKETCTFGMNEFNLSKRAPQDIQVDGRGKNGSAGGGNTSGGGSTSSATPVILLDFDGQVVSGTMWNVNGDIICAPANLSAGEMSIVIQRVMADYAPFNITVTTDEAVYNSAPYNKRIRVIVTESWEWFGQAGGVSYIGSFTWGNNTPCFVFSSLLGYNSKKIGEASAHEAGHTLGLRHQSSYDANGVKTSDYNWGYGYGETGWAPIMGAAYNQNLSLWHYGPNSISSTNMQNDIAVIAGVVGFKNDDFSNTTTGAAALSTTMEGIMNSSSDQDFFTVKLTSSKLVNLIPQNVGVNNDGSDLDLVLRVYNSKGVLLQQINDPQILNAATLLSAGNYYLSVSTAGNMYTSNYGMLSKYRISLN